MIETISRSEFKAVIERLIGRYPELAWRDKRRLRRVARTASRVLTDSQWWNEKEGCGCPVGTFLHGTPRASGISAKRHQPLVQLGIDYIYAIQWGVSPNRYAPIITIKDPS